MAKTGRNQPCPCGSGVKFKKCHGALGSRPPCPSTDEGIAKPTKMTLEAVRAARAQRELQQGLGRPIMSTVADGRRIVVVGDSALVNDADKWKTFHDVLMAYPAHVFGLDWINAERAKGEADRHPFVILAQRMLEQHRSLGTQRADGVVNSPMTGAAGAFFALSYNLYLTAHNAELQDRLVARLKVPQLFWPAVYETYVASTFIKAGFALEFEDEGDESVGHVEFTAVAPDSGNRYSVEAKARDRASSPSEDGKVDRKYLGVGRKLRRALKKPAAHRRVVFIDVNVPPRLAGDFSEVAGVALDDLRDVEKTMTMATGDPAPPAYVFITNHSYHHDLATRNVAPQATYAGFRIDDFGVDVQFDRAHDYVRSRERHADMYALIASIETHGEIPTTFDGELPQLAFSPDQDMPRLLIGHRYLVPEADGTEVEGELVDACANEVTGSVLGIYRLADGRSILCENQLTDDELAAHNRSPTTFFGVLREKTTKVESVTALFDFFYDTYRATPREKLLEWVADAPDINELMKLDQEDLAITLCERMAVSPMRDKENAGPKKLPERSASAEAAE